MISVAIVSNATMEAVRPNRSPRYRIYANHVALMLIVMLLYVWSINQDASGIEVGFATQWWVPVLTALGLSGVFLAIDLLTPRKKISTISGVAFDLLKTVSMLSDDMAWTTWGMCGKKQPIPVGMGGPAIKCTVSLGGK